MRKILFRGKLSHSKEWVEGNLIIARNGQPYIIPFDILEPDGHHLIIDSDNPFLVIPETVCQFTGLTDKDEKMIFEGDILNGEIRNNETRDFVVYFLYGGFSIKAPFWAKEKELLNADELILQPLSDAQTASWINSSCEIIGSIHDNQEFQNK